MHGDDVVMVRMMGAAGSRDQWGPDEELIGTEGQQLQYHQPGSGSGSGEPHSHRFQNPRILQDPKVHRVTEINPLFHRHRRATDSVGVGVGLRSSASHGSLSFDASQRSVVRSLSQNYMPYAKHQSSGHISTCGNDNNNTNSNLANETFSLLHPSKNQATNIRSTNNNNNIFIDAVLAFSTDAVAAAKSTGTGMSTLPSAGDADSTSTNTGPSLLYRLVAVPPPNEPLPWDLILQRAKSHPHEACVYDPNAGGHVYALHRLLRRAGDNPSCRPPLSVVEAVMQACPRAITRKQAMIDEDELMDDGRVNASTNIRGWRNKIANVDSTPIWHSALHNPPHNDALLHFVEGGGVPLNNSNAAHPHNNNGGQNHHPQGRDIGDRQRPNEIENDTDHDDVRYEYPLAIACEYEQGGEVIRLLASYTSKAKPAYRSEVFRSLDFVSLPNSTVRILLEEYAGCILERGVNSEATEGDDDDCPLEQVLFWWDDPDMMGMEEAILKYPNCSMRDDLCVLWEKLRMMLYAASTGTMQGYDDSKESFKVLHHVLRIACEGGIQDVRFPNDVTHALLLLAKFIQREKISMFEERDESGSFPIHIAVSGKGLLRQNEPSTDIGWNGEMTEEGNDQERNGQHRNNAVEELAVDGGFEANGGEHAAAGEVVAHEHNGGRQHGPVGAQQQEEDEDGEEDYEADDNADEEDDEDVDTSTGSMEIVRLLLDQYPASIRMRDSQSGSLPVHLALQHNPCAVNAIEHLLDRCPRSVMMPDGNGRLAMHLALIHKSPTWTSILRLSPTVLETRDPVTGLLPFQLAAMAKPVSHDDTQVQNGPDDQCELDLLSTCFYLLRMSPCLASGLADVEPPPRSLIEQQIMFRCKPRVTKLEEENERLRRRVDELELKLGLMQMGESGVSATTSGPHVKKRKSSLREHFTDGRN